MDKQRAEEIMNTLHMINVKYRGFPVYIKQVNQSKATVFPLDEIHHEQEVELTGLYEEGPI